MEKQTLVLSGVAGLLGLLSVIMGFAAEATRIKDSEVVYFIDTGTCYYPSSSALGLGITAAIILLLAEIITTIGSGCCGCCCKTNVTNNNSNKTLGIVFSVVSWIAFAIAFILFVVAAGENGPGNTTNTSCTVVKPGIFAAAAMLSLIAVGFGVASVITLAPMVAAAKGLQQGGQGIAMGQPQFAHQSNPQQPVNGNPYPGQPQFPPRSDPPVYAHP